MDKREELRRKLKRLQAEDLLQKAQELEEKAAAMKPDRDQATAGGRSMKRYLMSRANAQKCRLKAAALLT